MLTLICHTHIVTHTSSHALTHIQLFDTLRSEKPAVFDKVVPVAGDIMEPDMGLSEEDTQLLVENVSIVFHLAATVRFDAPARWVSVWVCVCVCVCVCVAFQAHV